MAASAGGRHTAGDEEHDGELARLGDLGDEVVRSLQLLRGDEQLVLRQGGEGCDLSPDLADVLHRLRDVPRAGLTLGADHRRTLVDTAERLAQVGRAADERHGEAELVDVVDVIGRREHLGLVDVVDAELLQHLRLDEVSDARLRHDGDRHRRDDAVDHVGIAHARDAALSADVGGNALECHDGDGSGVFGDLRLICGDDVHDHAALEHLGETALDARGSGGGLFGHESSCRVKHGVDDRVER